MTPLVITHVRAVLDGQRMIERARITLEAGRILSVGPDEGARCRNTPWMERA